MAMCISYSRSRVMRNLEIVSNYHFSAIYVLSPSFLISINLGAVSHVTTSHTSLPVGVTAHGNKFKYLSRNLFMVDTRQVYAGR